ncbi:hypothetical protein NJ959_29100, partial [Symplocastrum sp. BBK-W-15]
YSDRIKGERAENLELAIACYRNALTIYTPEAFPEDWAKTQKNLEIAYNQSIRGDDPDQMETLT